MDGAEEKRNCKTFLEEHFHHILVMISAFALSTSATVTLILIAYPQKNDYIDINLDLINRAGYLVYTCVSLLCLGLVQLVSLFVLLLHCQQSQSQRKGVIIYAMITSWFALAILVIFALQPKEIVDLVLPEDYIIKKPVESAMSAELRSITQGDHKALEGLKLMQFQEKCCLSFLPGEAFCVIADSKENQIERISHTCLTYLYGYYDAWLSDSKTMIRIVGIFFSVLLTISIIISLLIINFRTQIKMNLRLWDINRINRKVNLDMAFANKILIPYGELKEENDLVHGANMTLTHPNTPVLLSPEALLNDTLNTTEVTIEKETEEVNSNGSESGREEDSTQPRSKLCVMKQY